MWRRFFGKQKTERDLHDELQQYITEATREKIASGMPPDEARRTALIEFGGVEQVKEIMREGRRAKRHRRRFQQRWCGSANHSLKCRRQSYRRRPQVAGQSAGFRSCCRQSGHSAA